MTLIIQVIHPTLDIPINLPRAIHERLLHALARLCTSLHERLDPIPLSPSPGLLDGDLTLIFTKVTFITDEDDGNVCIGRVAQLLQPLCSVRERRAPRDVVHQQSARCATEVGLGYRAEGLLSRCVPDLQFYLLRRRAVVDGDYTATELYADGYVVGWVEAALAEADGELLIFVSLIAPMDVQMDGWMEGVGWGGVGEEERYRALSTSRVANVDHFLYCRPICQRDVPSQVTTVPSWLTAI